MEAVPDRERSKTNTGASTIGAIERAAEILLHIASSPDATVGVTEIANELGMSKAVVHRTLSSLKEYHFVESEDSTRRYRLGPSAVTIGAAYLERLSLRQLARPAMERLVTTTGETATLSLRNGWSRLYIDQVVPDREVMMSVRLGVPFPLHAGASSKAFLAFLEESDIDAYLAQPTLAGLTPTTLTEPSEIREELERVRERGYASSLGERQAGAASVAAPVFDHRGSPAAVVSVSGPIERFQPNVARAAEHLLEETALLSTKMGGKVAR